jgi:hypothetical protein
LLRVFLGLKVAGRMIGERGEWERLNSIRVEVRLKSRKFE